jgi:hypothetical protein
MLENLPYRTGIWFLWEGVDHHFHMLEKYADMPHVTTMQGECYMKYKRLLYLFILCSVLFWSTHALGVETESTGAPAAFFPEESFEFGPVVEGTIIQHDFVIQNRGTAELLIKKVKSG